MLPNTDVGNQCTAKRYETFPDEVLSLIFTLLLLSLKKDKQVFTDIRFEN